MPRHSLAEFDTLPYPILDVRAPIEFVQGHVPGAVNLPLFSDEERASIGTTYKQVSQERAVHLGLEFFGPKMSGMVKQAQRLAGGKEVRLHCWRGGMRSGAVLWLLELAGFKVHLLDHGYKDYRRAVLASFAQPRQWRVLGGLTGSGKTNVLHELAATPGQPVLDLEGLAHHKGSAFGAIGQPAQPTQEQFENNLAAALAALPADAPIWVEDESRQIGRLTIPPALFAQLQAAPRFVLEVPRAARVAKLAAEYGAEAPAELAAAIERLQKRLGGLATQQALAAVEAGNFPLMVELVLDYYDKTYTYGLAPRPGEPPRTLVPVAGCDAAANAAQLRQATAILTASASLE
ncbi:tRNA 2-selenouridine synthase [Hymenobacter sp. UYAg731]